MQQDTNISTKREHDLAPPPAIQDPSYSEASPNTKDSFHSLPPTGDDFETPQDEQRPKSMSPTLDTNPGTTHSDGVVSDGHSKAGTTGTRTGGLSSVSGGGDTSIFSSSNHSARSLSTTLTTIQSQPSTAGNNVQQTNGLGNLPHNHNLASAQHSSQPSQSSAYFNHQFPTNPASAVPPHLNPTMHVPTTYRSATANNLLSDNASVLTLASSSHRAPRRNSLDSNASIRAIAPNSAWGGSRESLPLSILSQTPDAPGITASGTPPSTASMPHSTSMTRSISGLERTPVYSGVGAPALSSERNSIYASKTPAGDGASSLHDRMSLKAGSLQNERFDGTNGSIRSGQLSHSRNASVTGSIGGLGSPLST